MINSANGENAYKKKSRDSVRITDSFAVIIGCLVMVQ